MSSGITTRWPANQSDAKLLEGGVDECNFATKVEGEKLELWFFKRILRALSAKMETLL